MGADEAGLAVSAALRIPDDEIELTATWNASALVIVELTGTRAPIVYEPLPTDDPKVRRPDITRAKTMLGWEPRVPVREGVAKTVEYFRALMQASVA